MSRPNRHDEGFSLTEMLVVIVLMGIVLSATYAVFTLMARARENQERDAYVASAIITPLQSMTVVLSQNTRIDPPPASGEYQLSCYSDQNADGNMEKHVYSVVNGNLQDVVYSTDSNLNATGIVKRIDFGTARANPVAQNTNSQALPATIPMFVYYSRDASGSVVQTTSPSGATEVLVQLRSRYDGRDYRDSRHVMFRNERTQ
jgi:prepilin-type N-terminal cleavage/methylation domain-containing protein